MDDIYLPETITKEKVQELVTSNIAELSAIEKQANEARQKANDARQKAKDAREKAEEIEKSKTNWFLNKESIIALKEGNLALAEALESSTFAQEAQQKQQTSITKLISFILQVSISSVAAGDAAIERLQQIVGDNKEAKEISDQTREEIDGIISTVKHQQSLFKKLDDVKKRINEQQNQITLLSQKIDSLSVTSDENGNINVTSLITSLNEPFKQVINVCNESSEIVKDCFETLNKYLIEEVASIKSTIVNKSNNSEAVLNEHMVTIRDYFKRINDSYIQLLEAVSLEAANVKSELEGVCDRCEAIKAQNDELSQKIEEKEKKNAFITKRTNIITFISLGVIALIVIACLIVLLVRK